MGERERVGMWTIKGKLEVKGSVFGRWETKIEEKYQLKKKIKWGHRSS